VAVTAHGEEDAHALKKAGAELIFHPYFDAAEYAAQMITDALNPTEDAP
jgi:Trk K+ transport system NAD-binding subunit